MNICPDSFFSFILFSFNGIDCISHEDRFRVFKEVQRVGRAGVLFCFSTHNLQGLHHLEFRAQLADRIKETGKNISRVAAAAVLLQPNLEPQKAAPIVLRLR